MKPTDKIFCNTFGTHFQMYYKMRILPVIFLARTSVLFFFSMITKAQDNFIDPGLSDTWCKPMILNKGMTGIGIARRYWLFFYIIEEPIYYPHILDKKIHTMDS